MRYLIAVGMICCRGECVSCYSKLSNYAHDIGVTRSMTKDECLMKLKKIKRFIVKNNMGQPLAVCEVSDN